MKIFKINIPKQIITLLLLVLILSFSRVIIFGSYSLVYILWNIFLAIIPFFISSFLLIKNKEEKISKKIFIIISIFWILLLPNAPYLVTDLIHIGGVYNVPALYDVFLLFSSAYIGLLLGFHSLFHMEQIFRMKFSYKKTNNIINIIILLTSFGIYLGRFLRFNSWDIFFNHKYFLSSIKNVFLGRSLQIEAILYTLLFFIFIYLSYIAWKYSKKDE